MSEPVPIDLEDKIRKPRKAAALVAVEAPTVPATVDNSPMVLLKAALDRGADMGVLEKLMDLQERWEANQARKAFDEAVSDAKARIKPIVRNATGHNQKKYADFAAIAKEVDPVLGPLGLSYRFRSEQQDGKISVTCRLSHKAGHAEETTLTGPADTTGSKNAIQAIGSTTTYLQRYTLVLMLGLAASNDDDGNAAGTNQALTDEQVSSLFSLIAETNSNIDQFLIAAKVEPFDDGSERDIDAVRAKLAEIKGSEFKRLHALLETKKRKAAKP